MITEVITEVPTSHSSGQPSTGDQAGAGVLNTGRLFRTENQKHSAPGTVNRHFQEGKLGKRRKMTPKGSVVQGTLLLSHHLWYKHCQISQGCWRLLPCRYSLHRTLRNLLGAPGLPPHLSHKSIQGLSQPRATGSSLESVLRNFRAVLELSAAKR